MSGCRCQGRLAVEALHAKAAGRLGVNAARMWAFMTTSVYQSGDLPVLATREALQNGIDSIKAGIRARTTRSGAGRFDVTWDPARRALTWEDNGVGMDADTILTKFLSLGDSGKRDAGDSEEAAGGFGVAKAVILGTSRTFRWELHTRDNLAVSAGADVDVQVFDAPTRQGTRLTIFDVPDELDARWDGARRAYVPLRERLRELLAANDLPEVTLTLDGEVVPPMFSRRGGAKVPVTGAWGQGVTATVKAYRRPPGDRGGAYYLRLGGLLQFKAPSQRGELKADLVVDLVTTVRPGTRGYPFNAARDALQDHARWAFRDLVDEVERESARVENSGEDEIFEPDSDDADARRGADALADLAAAAFADADFQRALAEAAGGLSDLYAAQARAPGVTVVLDGDGDGDGPTRGAALPPGFAPPAADAGSPTRALREVLDATDLSDAVRGALDRADAGTLDGWDIRALSTALEQAADAATAPGGGGLLQVAAITARGEAALDALTPDWLRPAARPARRNPFGRLAGLRISKKNYDRPRAARFRRNFQRWMPHLTAWDATLRLISNEARIRRHFKPGFVLDDALIGLTTSTPAGANVVYLHPDRLAEVIQAHRERPLAIAAFLHGVAVHELTHLDGRMGRGHDEAYVTAREDLGHATGHLLPAISVLVQRVLGLPTRPSEDQRRVATLERQLAQARTARKDGRRLQARLEAALASTQRALAEAQAESARVRATCARCCPTCRPTDAARVLEAAARALRSSPPPGVDSAYLDAFLHRHHARLHDLISAALARSPR